MNNKYKPIDNSMKIFDKVQAICKRNLTDDSTLEDFLDLYNSKIRKELNLKRADDVKSALSVLWLLGFYDLAKRITKQLNKGTKDEITLAEIEEGLIDKELEKSMKKAIRYSTKNSNVTKKKGTKTVSTVVAGVTALAMINRFTSRTKAVINTRGVDIISQKEFNKAKRFGYEYFTFYAELDSRTTPKCREMHGKTFKLSDGVIGVNIPPLHINCRSSLVYHN